MKHFDGTIDKDLRENEVEKEKMVETLKMISKLHISGILIYAALTDRSSSSENE